MEDDVKEHLADVTIRTRSSSKDFLTLSVYKSVA